MYHKKRRRIRSKSKDRTVITVRKQVRKRAARQMKVSVLDLFWSGGQLFLSDNLGPIVMKGYDQSLIDATLLTRACNLC